MLNYRRFLSFFFLLGGFFFMVGCGVDEPIPTAVIPSTETPTQTPPPSATFTIQATETAVPTAISITIPLPTPTPLPPLEGQIIFLWDSESPPLSYGTEPKQSLYRAEPGKSPSEWHIQPLLNDLYGLPVTALSPDQSKLALMVLEDRTNDGTISYGSFKRGGDAPNLYIYSLSTGSFERITDDYPSSYYLGWTPDSQEITFPDDLKVLSYNIITETTQLLSDSYPDEVAQVAWSPDGNPLAVKLYSGPLYFFNQEMGENVQSPDELANSPSLIISWSPDGTWLASNISYGAGLLVMNRESSEVIELVTSDFYSIPAWSPTSTQIAFLRLGRESNSSLLIANTDNLVPITVFEAKALFPAVWKPDGAMLVVGYSNENDSGLLIVDSETGQSRQLLNKSAPEEFHPLVWSLDGTWLLFFNRQAENAGLYIIHRDGGEPYLLLDTTDTSDPFAISWLSEAEIP